MQASRVIAVAVLGLTLAGCSGNGGAPALEFTKEDNAAVHQLFTDFVAAYNGKDSVKAAGFFAGAGVLMPPNTSTIRGPESIEGFWKDRFLSGYQNLQLEAKELNGRGTLALISAPFTLDIVAPEGGESRHERGKSFWVAEKLGGKWLFQSLIWNSDLPVPTPPPPAEKSEKTDKK